MNQSTETQKRAMRNVRRGLIVSLLILLIGGLILSLCAKKDTSSLDTTSSVSMKEPSCPAEYKSWKEGKTFCHTHCTETIDHKIEDTLYSRTDTIAMGSARVEVYTEWVSSTKDHPIVEINQVYDITHKQTPIHTRHKGKFGGF